MSTGEEPESRKDVGGVDTAMSSSPASWPEPSTGVLTAGSSSSDSWCASLERSAEDKEPAVMSLLLAPSSCLPTSSSSGVSGAAFCLSLTASACLSTLSACFSPTLFRLLATASFSVLTFSSSGTPPCCIPWSTSTCDFASPCCVPWSRPAWELVPPCCTPLSTPTWELVPPCCVPLSTPTWDLGSPCCVPLSTPTWELASSSVAGSMCSSGRVKVRFVVPVPLVMGIEHVELTLASTVNSSNV